MTSAGTAAERHVPVLRDRIVELLGPALAQGDSAGPAVFLDATLGHGGHTAAILAAYPSVRAIGLDRDASALASARERLGVYADRVTFVQAVYDELAEVLRSLELATVSAILFDLGVSSMQLDDPERGFAYRYDAPLDMRMDQGDGVTAAEILNTYAAGDLERVLREYGEERFARRIARAIVTERAASPFDHSARLVEVIRSAIPVAAQHGGGHPAKRTFQALRIEVNDELAVWRRAVSVAIDVLDVGGRIAVLSYHSLEDRIAKQAFAAGSQSRTPHGLPVELPDAQPYLRLVTRGAERPSAVEESANPRAASARLRVAERIRRGSPVGGDLTGGTAYQPYRSHRTTSKGPRR